jgi:hypothetical protein
MGALKLYAHAPYDVDESRLDQAIALMRLMQAEGVVIASHEPSTAYDRLLAAFPAMDWVVRVKGSRAWWPNNLHAVEWPGERSAMDTVAWLTTQGIRPLVVLWNEPDTELPDPWKADDPDERQRWIAFYRDAAERARVQLRMAFGSSVALALAPLSQGGPPDRFETWVTGLTDLYPEMDVIVEHCYSPEGTAHDDPEWGGRYLRWAEWAHGMPILITETNLNG